MGTELLATAEQALELAQADPGQSRQLALAVLPQASATRDHVAASVASRALGQIATGLEDLTSATAHLRAALRFAQRAGDARREAEARMSLGLVLVQQGRAAAALRQLDQAAPALSGPDAGRLLNQRAAVLYHLGRYTEALEVYDAALAISRSTSDQVNEIRLLSNRGVLHAVRGDHAAAERDLQRAQQLAGQLSLGLMAANILQNLGWLAAREGNIPLALERYDAAEKEYLPHSEPLGTLLLDRCDVLLAARLLPEAKEAAERALQAFTEGGLDALAAEARLYLAEVALLAEDADAAAAAASAACRAFVRQRRPAWSAMARYAALRACLLQPELDPVAARRTALAVARALDRAGWRTQALDVRVVAAQLALLAGRPELARRSLEAAAAVRRRGTVEMRTRAWHAEALLRRAAGDRRGARAALNSGLRLAEEYRATLGATDLRAAATGHRVELARLGFTIAVEDGRPADALRWVERYRAGLLRLPPARPPDDAELAAELAALRTTVADLEEAIRDGRDPDGLLHRQEELERAIRDRCRRRTSGRGAPPSTPELKALSSRLGDRALVEFVTAGNSVFGLTLVDRTPHVVRLASVQEMAAEIERLLFLLRRLAGRHGTAAGQAAAAAAIDTVAARLDAKLLQPLAPLAAARELVVVPTGVLHPVPWTLLPSCRGRAVSVAPSATAWYEAAGRALDRRKDRDGSPPRVVAVAGPGLPGAVRETAAVTQLYPGADVLTGPNATAAATLATLDGADLAHLAMHNVLRHDNPLFSSLRLADGPLTVYDLERIERVPSTVVLSACESARTAVRPGDDQLGVGAALLALGADVLIASVVPVPDADTVPFMIDFHARLSRGQAPAAALASAQRHVIDELGRSAPPGSLLAVAGFVCLGAG